MLEHTGIDYLHEYFGVIKDLLTENGSIATFQATMMSESYQADSQATGSFICKHIFPGGYLPTLTETVAAINKGAGDHFVIDRVENFGGLGRAFQAWGEAFDQDFDARIRPDLVTRQLCDAEIEKFRRKWRFYFAYCQAGFEEQVLRTVTVRLVRMGTSILAQDYYM
ncbi:Cyclopropane-fatty-acyl-phospholipid synthase [Purpureocillium takamizusanense]|uniref:Cyclopropane-fatty-acyl-phospholipid synthase n=1 Tax=Purpureocillium takamizusanense TaxID=2060973 RepID=A0A9Q8QPD2_9HYPO|nr:Cyclopropane-fatty-acyl-phospholipid synthase [Purpureocillium takamizusanense]UNI23333.1 Cyclopropane-fatty-acyl-phospholipid synthase [Purpureocillium takamizusanense]